MGSAEGCEAGGGAGGRVSLINVTTGIDEAYFRSNI